MHTTTFHSYLAVGRTRVVRLAATFVAATVGLVGPAAAALTSLSVGTQTGTLTAGTAGSATYVITVNRTGTTPNNVTFTVGALGANASSGGTSALSGWSATSGGTRTYQLAVNTSATRVAGTTIFTVSSSSGGTTRSGTATLTVNPAVPAVAPTITFGPAPTPTYLGGNFTVSATTNSNGVRTYSAVSGPCAVVSASLGTFSSSGAGACTVRASTAATSAYLAGSADQVVTIAKANQTITFNALPNRFVGDSSFAVSGTATSGLALSFAAAGNCTVAGSTVSLTTPPTLPGTCTITASQAGNTNYNVAPNVPQTFAINAFTGVELSAIAGSAALPGQTVPVWGYTDGRLTVNQPGGPTLTFNQGDTVAIRLHNQLPAPTALLFQGQSMVPDLTGVAPGQSKIYTFIANRPGTYLYEAGLLPNAQYQVAMGLYGALVVRPTSDGTATGTPILNQAYADAATTFNDEAVLVLSEIDPALNILANPASFDMRNFAPQYFLINGKAYPATETDPIPSAAGNKLLLRYVNAGAKHHSMAVLGLRQNFVAKDGGLLPTLNHNVAAETLAPGQTGDAIATIPAVTSASRFAIYDGSLMLRNSSAPGIGGMLTFVTAGTGTPVAGPAVTALALTGNPRTALTATIAASSGGTVTNWQYWVDSGAPTTASITTPALTVNVIATIPVQPTGNHNLYVRGQDNLGNWGAIRALAFAVDTTGPVTSGLTLTPNPSNGTVVVALHATSDDRATGGANITQAEYFIGAPGANGSGTAMTVNTASPVASLDATLNPPVSGGVISVHSRDALGNWGPFATIPLNVVGTGPSTSGVSATYSPNNGTKPLNATQAVVRIAATLTSAGSTVAAAEGFIDTVGANGTGFQFVPSDGVWNGSAEAAYGDIPLAAVAALSAGNHTIYVHGRDATGNWGATSTTTLVIDKTPPTVSSINRVGATPTNATSVQFLVTFSESVTGGDASNFTLATSGVTGASIASVSAGPGVTRTVTVNTGTGSGTIGLNMASTGGVTDLAGNAVTPLPVTGQVFTIDKTAPTFTSVTISPTSINVGTASVTMAVAGSADTGGSGLANAGEYWFDTASIPAGSGTAFTGTSGIAVSTSTLTVGTHTLRVRIRDNAGNWSIVRTASLTVNPSGPALVAPTAVKAFAGAVRGGNGTQTQRTTTLTITLSNSNGSPITGVALTDNLPQPPGGLLASFTVVSSSTTCGGTTSTQNSSRRLLLSGGTIPANGSCTVSATVRLSAGLGGFGTNNGPFTLTNTIAAGGVTSTNAGSNAAAAGAVLTVNP